MSVIEKVKFAGFDGRKRGFVIPERIMETKGIVEMAENLLIEKPLQIGLGEPLYSTFTNKKGEKRASVVLDFGREMNGGIRLLVSKCSGKDYVKFRITFGESLTEVNSTVGKKGATNDHTARQFTVPVMSFSDQTFGETGFRFVKIELLTPECSVNMKSAVGVFVFRDYDYRGSFECDDEIINKIYDTSVYTVHLCCQGMLWDGIKRDRLVWIGDMMVESKVIHDVFGNVPIVPESLEFIRDLTPVTNWMNSIPSYSAWWLMLVKDWYVYTGDLEFLNRQKDYSVKLIDRFCDIVGDDGEDKLPGYFLDWPTRAYDAESKSGVRALLKMMLFDAVVMCEAWDEKELSEKCKEAIKRLEKRIGEHNGFKQVAAVMSLAGDMDKTAAAEVIEKEETRGLSTFMSYFQLMALARAGREEKAMSLMKEYYSFMLDKGATSFWEDYHTDWNDGSGDILGGKDKTDIHSDYGAYCYKGLRHSLCHGWSAGPVPFINEVVLGVNVLESGCKTIDLRPNLCGLKWAKGVYPTPYGDVKIEHILGADGKISTKFEAPEGVKVTVFGKKA